ncbi:MAG TPA: response regulator [Ktedonobacterales bacterium]|nr:response regulator [Ktedonobacterales bacterium]
MSESSAAGYTVLIVDDDPDLLQALTDGLELLGNYRVVSATDGMQALERFYETRPDCAIVDVKMPGLDGYQLVRALRGDAETAATPLIILSALAQEQNQFAGLALGADEYLVKLASIYDVVAAVQRVIALSAAERQQQMQALLEQVEASETAEQDPASSPEAIIQQNQCAD